MFFLTDSPSSTVKEISATSLPSSQGIRDLKFAPCYGSVGNARAAIRVILWRKPLAPKVDYLDRHLGNCRLFWRGVAILTLRQSKPPKRGLTVRKGRGTISV